MNNEIVTCANFRINNFTVKKVDRELGRKDVRKMITDCILLNKRGFCGQNSYDNFHERWASEVEEANWSLMVSYFFSFNFLLDLSKVVSTQNGGIKSNRKMVQKTVKEE